MNLNLAELIDCGANIALTVSANDLREFARSIVEQTKDDIEASIAENRSEVYYTPEQVMSLVNVCRRTLFRWQKGGYLTPVKVGGLTRYRKSDIDKIIGSDV